MKSEIIFPVFSLHNGPMHRPLHYFIKAVFLTLGFWHSESAGLAVVLTLSMCKDIVTHLYIINIYHETCFYNGQKILAYFNKALSKYVLTEMEMEQNMTDYESLSQDKMLSS